MCVPLLSNSTATYSSSSPSPSPHQTRSIIRHPKKKKKKKKKMHPLLISLLRLIYPLNLPTKTRDRPLQVLALGISRSATESLRQALLHLGYINCYHGFDYVNAPNHSIQWIRLGWAQENSSPLTISREEFDRVLGDCSAVTDFPCGGFAEELLDLYPSAKVILNYRDDVDAWARSVENTLEVVVKGQEWEEWFLTFFQSNLFWRQRSLYWVWSRFFGGDFENGGKEWYRRHYSTLEERLRGSGRKFLRWKVEDGW